MTQINRNEIVTNGCSGACCERFIMHYSLEDLIANKEALKNGKTEFVDCQGQLRATKNDNTLDTIIDMLIPLELTEYDPASGNNMVNLVSRKFDIAKDVYIASEVEESKQRVTKKLLENGYIIEDDEEGGIKVLVRTFTCRHFDKMNRICTIYENRPHMCRSFNEATCTYKGCQGKCLNHEKELASEERS